jgi:hypothetical protein
MAAAVTAVAPHHAFVDTIICGMDCDECYMYDVVALVRALKDACVDVSGLISQVGHLDTCPLTVLMDADVPCASFRAVLKGLPAPTFLTSQRSSRVKTTYVMSALQDAVPTEVAPEVVAWIKKTYGWRETVTLQELQRAGVPSSTVYSLRRQASSKPCCGRVCDVDPSKSACCCACAKAETPCVMCK